MEIIATRAQQLRNTEAAIAAWKNVAPEAVSRQLKHYRDGSTYGAPSCSSPACFGGHLPYMQHFRDIGVRRSAKGGYPVMRGRPTLHTYELSNELFGDSYMFDARRGSEPGMDHEVVEVRLRANLQRLRST